MNAADSNDVATDERLRDLAARFQQAWQAHREEPQAVDLASFLPPPGDSLRTSALLRLIPLDLEGRWQNGVPLSLEDYVQRFPELGPLDGVPAQLIADEYRIRAQFGVISPQSVLKQRFPNQFAAVQKLIQSVPGQLAGETVVPMESVRPPLSSGLILLPSTIVGDHYQLNKQLGRGGFGEVWHATDLRGGIDKAIKILTRSADSAEAQVEFESLNIVKKINHPCLVRTESYFVERDRLFIVLELADATMRDLLKKSQTESRTGIAVDVLLTYMKHAAEGLDFLHRQGILHRDIKPENILIVGDYGKVADFGLAKTARNMQSTKAEFAGTVIYSAPETWDGRVTTRSDQYSLAATYFELRTGRALFGGKTFQEIFCKHLAGNPDFSPLPDLEQDVLRQALSKKPEDRFATCAAFVHALHDAVVASGSKVVASQPPVPPPPTHKKNAETTLDGDSAVSRVNAGVRAATALRSNPEQAAPRKWNEAPGTRRAKSRSRMAPFLVLGGLVLGAALGAYAIREFVMTGGSAVTSNDNIPKTPDGPPADVPPSTTAPPKADAPKPIPSDVPKPTPPKPISPARAALNNAAKLIDAKEFAKCKETLDGLAVMGGSDPELKRDGLALYAQLLQTADFSREQLRSLDAAIAGDPAVKPAFAEAMTRKLVDAWSEWSDNKAGWDQRIRDCENADPTNLVIRAMKVEADLETTGIVAQALPPAADEEPPFVTYVRARLAASRQKIASAAALAATLPADAEWLKGKRATRAALLLQDAATELTPEMDGRLTLFASIEDAGRAYAWHKKALAFFHNPTLVEQRSSFTWQQQLNAALAGAYKSEPDFEWCKTIGANVLENPKRVATTGVVELALAHPDGFPDEFGRVRSKIGLKDLAPTLRLGADQLLKSPTNPALRARQARLLYTKGRLLDREEDADPVKILETDKAALELESTNLAYFVAVGRDAALVALASAKQTADSAARIKECEKGLADSAQASRASAEAELWADLSRLRGLLYLEIGREVGRPADWTKPAAKQAFRNAIAAVKPALDKSPPNDAELAAVMAQAYEALAHLSRDNIEKNFTEAAEFYGLAAATRPRYAFERGRCYYRWATDDDLTFAKAKKNALLNDALGEFEKLAKLADFPDAAEASYWEALAHWDRLERLTSSPKAKAAFERSLKAAAQDLSRGGAWARYALDGLVKMTRRQAKNAPETSAEWLAAVLPAWQALSKDEALGADEGFVAAGREYRDLLAETSADAAARLLKFNNLGKYRAHIDRAYEMKHSSKHAQIAVARAVNFRKHEKALGLTPAETDAAHREAAAAIEAAPPPVRALLRQALKSGLAP